MSQIFFKKANKPSLKAEAHRLVVDQLRESEIPSYYTYLHSFL